MKPVPTQPITLTLHGLEPDRLRDFLTTLINDTEACRCVPCYMWAAHEAASVPYIPLDHPDEPMDSDQIRADHREVLFTLESQLYTAITLRDKEKP